MIRNLLFVLIPASLSLASCTHMGAAPATAIPAQAPPQAQAGGPAQTNPQVQAAPAPKPGAPDLATRLFIEDMLVSKGHKRAQVHGLVNDPRVSVNTGIIVSNLFFSEVSGSAKNPKVMDVNPKWIPRGVEFIEKYSDAFDAAWERYKVSPEAITSILIIETNLGSYPMKYNVFRVYASLTAALDAEYLEAALAAKGDKYKVNDQILSSARKKGSWGLGELSALIQLCEKLQIDPIGINGSFAGALGPAQFIPSSFVKFGVDGNADGKVNPFDMEDCIASIANYLKLAGWKEEGAIDKKRQAIWIYNHHEVYVNTVMMLYDKLIAAGEEYTYEEEVKARESVQAPAEAGTQKPGAQQAPAPDQARETPPAGNGSPQAPQADPGK